MKTLCLILLFHASLQLQCDKNKVSAPVGGEFTLICKYDTSRFLYNKKYWCRGNSKSTCEILVDSEDTIKKSHRFNIVNVGRRGLVVKVTDLQFDDTGTYWVGIDKVYADIMTAVNVLITEVPVSKPSLWPLSSLADRPTCWGKPVIVRCGCTKGTAVRCAWYQHTKDKQYFLQHSPDLHLQCGQVQKDSDYYCTASNNISSQRSDRLSVQVLTPADHSCIYVVYMQGQPFYDCDDRMTTTTTTTTTTKTTPMTSCQATEKILSNQTDSENYQELLFRTWTGVPFWYALLRWGSFASLLIFLCIVLTCTKARQNRAMKSRRRRRRRRRRGHCVTSVPRLAH